MSANKGFSHPMYNGKETPLKTALEEIKPKNAFICLGINDVAIYGVDGTVKNYCKLINMIRKINPEVHVYVVSTTLMVDNAQGRNLRNIGIINLNHNMKQLCETNENLDYIDIMSALQSEDFALNGSYCSDGYIHQSNSAYKIWLEKLGVE
jgi:lysophospholipase L1-like esterase